MRRVLSALVLAAIVAGCERQTPEPTGELTAKPAGASASGIWTSAWRLTDLGGDGVIGSAEATLEFPEEGRAVGRGSCNRFFAIVAVTGETIRFSGIGSTRMACADPLATQEAKYLKALESAERFAIEGDELVIHSSALAEPLRFSAHEFLIASRTDQVLVAAAPRRATMLGPMRTRSSGSCCSGSRSPHCAAAPMRRRRPRASTRRSSARSTPLAPGERLGVGVLLVGGESLPPRGSARRAAVAALQDRVLAALPADSFTLVRRYRRSRVSPAAQPPRVSRRWRADPGVAAVYLDGRVRAQLVEGSALIGARPSTARATPARACASPCSTPASIPTIRTWPTTSRRSTASARARCPDRLLSGPVERGRQRRGRSGPRDERLGNHHVGGRPGAARRGAQRRDRRGQGARQRRRWELLRRRRGARLAAHRERAGRRGRRRARREPEPRRRGRARELGGVAVHAAASPRVRWRRCTQRASRCSWRRATTATTRASRFPPAWRRRSRSAASTTPTSGSVSWCGEDPLCATALCTDNPTAADTFVCHTNSGALLDLLAPDYQTRTSGLGGGVEASFGGTSAACPYAAAEAALLFEADPSLTPDEVRSALAASGPLVENPESGLSFPRANVESGDRVAAGAGFDRCSRPGARCSRWRACGARRDPLASLASPALRLRFEGGKARAIT